MLAGDATTSTLAEDNSRRQQRAEAMAQETWPQKVDAICNKLSPPAHSGRPVAAIGVTST